jgi:hypothetical protein
VLAAAVALLSVVYSLFTPVFEGPDEIWHFAFADHLARGGSLPVLDAANPAILLRNAAHPPLYYWAAAALIAPIDRSDFPTAFRFNLASPRITPGSISDRPNLLIHTAHEDFPYRQTTLAVHAARLISAALGGLTVVWVWAGARRLVPDLALWAAALAGGIPQFVYGAGVVNNDALAAAAAAATLLALIALMQEGRPLWAAAAGVGLGVALLSKIGMVALLPLPAVAVGLGLVWPAAAGSRPEPGSGRGGVWRAVGQLALLYGLAALIAGWWYGRNWWLYGDPLAWREWQALAGAGRPTPTLGEWLADMAGLFGTFWADFGMRIDRRWIWGFLPLAGAVALGWGRRFARREWPTIYWPGLALTTAAFALLLISAIRYALVITEIHGRLLYPALTAMGVVMAIGLSGWGPRPGRWLLLAGAASLWAVAAGVPVALIRPAYARPVVAGGKLPADTIASAVWFGDQVGLVGYAAPPERALPGEAVTIRTYWRAVAEPGGSATVEIPDLRGVVALVRPDGQVLGRGEARLGTSVYPTSVWQPGEVVSTDVTLRVTAVLEGPALAAVWLGVRADATDLLPASSGGDTLTLGHVALSVGQDCQPAVTTDVIFGARVRLGGYTLTPSSLTLCWTALKPLNEDYTVFVHLLDAAGNPLGTADGPPAGGQYPTTAWQPGEWVADSRALALPPGVAVEVGLYVLATGERLPVDGTSETAYALTR